MNHLYLHLKNRTLGSNICRLMHIFQIIKMAQVKRTGGPIKQVVCGITHTQILTENNEFWVCGYGEYGQLGIGHNENRNILTKLKWIG